MKKTSENTWNGYTYVNYGSGRNWEIAVKYGFVSAGGGEWYSNTLKKICPGEKVFVYTAPFGYVGYGIVTSTAQIAKDVVFDVNGKKKTFSDIRGGDWFLHDSNDPKMAEYVVKIDWKHHVSQKEAIKGKGLYAQRPTVCRSKKPEWDHTVEILKERWKLTD